MKKSATEIECMVFTMQTNMTSAPQKRYEYLWNLKLRSSLLVRLPTEIDEKQTRSFDMKSLIKRISIALVIASLAAVSVVAKTRKESISFTSNTTVNGTLVKKGKYHLKFDDEKGELSIVKDGKVIAQASTTAAKREAKAAKFELQLTGSGAERQLVGVAFGGSDQNIVISGASASR